MMLIIGIKLADFLKKVEILTIIKEIMWMRSCIM